MPKLMQLPTRRKEGTAHAPVTQKAKKPQVVEKVQKTSPVKQKAPSKNGTAPEPVQTNGRTSMRSAEIVLLEGLIGRIEVVEVRGRKQKPAVQISKGEFEALTLGLGILQSTVRTKK